MLQLVCEIFLALVVVFIIYLAFRRIFVKDNAISSPKEEENSGFDNNFDSKNDNKDINKKR